MSVLEELARLPEPLCVVPNKIIEYREEQKYSPVLCCLSLLRQGRRGDDPLNI